MGSHESDGFRLTVLNPGGNDPEQSFPEGAGEAGGQHPPVNFHAFAACTRGTFQRNAGRALAQNTAVLLLLRGDFRASQRALVELKKRKRVVALSLKETGLHQIAQQFSDPGKLSRFIKIIAMADGCIGITSEAADVCRAFLHITDSARIAFIPTPYPIGDRRWDFSRPLEQRAGIFVGTREWDVPTRNHLAALLLAREIAEQRHEQITIFQGSGRGAKLLGALNFSPERLRLIRRRLSYADYLRAVSRHKLVLQLDTSFVPGQVAGDALLCRLPCVGGNGAIDRLAFSETCGFGRSIADLREIALRLLRDRAYYEEIVATSQARAKEMCGFEVIATRLRDFFDALG